MNFKAIPRRIARDSNACRHFCASTSIVLWENNVNFQAHFHVSKRTPGSVLDVVYCVLESSEGGGD